MAIQYVGGQVGGRAGTVSNTTTDSLTDLTGGIGSEPQEGDLIIVGLLKGSLNRNNDQAISGWSTVGTQLFVSSVNYDTSLQVSYLFAGATPPTDVTIPPSGSNSDAQSWVIQVFRGVDPDTTFDVASVSATGTTTTKANPASITPTTSGAFVVVIGGGSASAAATFTSSDLADFLTNASADACDSSIGGGYIEWTSGAVDPAQFGGGNDNSNNSWASWTMALRPAAEPVTTITLDPSSDSVAPGDYVDFTAYVEVGGVAAEGVTVTVSSSNTGVATADAITLHALSAKSSWTSDAMTYSDPSETTPLGAAAYRFTETTFNGAHQTRTAGGPTMVSGQTYRLVFEWKPTTVATRTLTAIRTGSGGFAAQLTGYWNDSDSSFNSASSGANPLTYALGSGWIRASIEATATSAVELNGYLKGYETTADPDYVGDTGNYSTVGSAWIEQLSAVTDADGYATIRCRGVAAGTSNITATANSVDSDASVLTVSSGTTVSVPAASLTLTGYAPTVTKTANIWIDVPAGALTLTGIAPTVFGTDNKSVEVPAAALSLTAYAPTVAATANVAVDVPAAALTLAGIAPTVSSTEHVWVDVPAAALVLTSYAPTVEADASVSIDVPAAALEVTGYAPTLATTANVDVEVPSASLVLSGVAPTVSATANVSVSVPAGGLELTGQSPTVSATGHVWVDIPAAALAFTAYAPTVVSQDASVGQGGDPAFLPHIGLLLGPGVDVSVEVPTAALVVSGQAPTVQSTANVSVEVPAAGLSLTGYAPTVAETAHVWVDVPAAALTLTGQAPTVAATANVAIEVPAGALTLNANAPQVDVSSQIGQGGDPAFLPHIGLLLGATDSVTVEVPAAALTVTGYAPTLSATANQRIEVPTAEIGITADAPSWFLAGDAGIQIPAAALLIAGFAPTVTATGQRKRGGGGKRPYRYAMRIGEEMYYADSVEALEAALDEFERESEHRAKRKAQTATGTPKQVARKARRVRVVEVPEAELDTVKELVSQSNRRVRELYESEARAAMIARYMELEIVARQMDDDAAIVALSF